LFHQINTTMRKAIASFPAEAGTTVENNVHVITDMEQFPAYKQKHPLYAPLVKENFEKMLGEGEVIIIQSNGGWCTEGGGVNIVKYLDAPNWSVEKKDEIEKRFINIITRISMDIPSNFEDIVQYIYEDVCETADPENWSDGDIAIAFRRWIESKA
jgi:hypothetical protein